MSSMTKLIACTLLVVLLVGSASAHSRSLPSYNRQKRAAAASTCSYMQCAASGGSCSIENNIFCPAGQHCDNTNKCVADLALGASCSASAKENECSQGTCVSGTCQIYREIMPGNPCTADSQCFFSSSADGKTIVASNCTSGVCAGKAQGASCVASHQCVTGTFCSTASSTCTALGGKGSSCSANSECSGRFTCLKNVCSSRYTQSSGQACDASENCQPGLYCKSGSCAKISNKGRTSTTCDIQANSCGNDMECSCADFTTQGQTATCNAIVGTYKDMPKIETAAFDCLDKFSCGSDVNNNATVACIAANCVESYCNYFTRNAQDMLTDFPSCLIGQMVSSPYSDLLRTCTAYTPKPADATSASIQTTVSIATLSIAALFVFLF